MDVNVQNDLRVIIVVWWNSGKDNPIQIIRSFYNDFAFFTQWTWNGSNGWSRRFLDENDVKVFIDFQHYISKEFVFSNILWKYSEVS